MQIAVTGSIATDHLMSYPGKIADQLIADQLQQVSLSFLVEELVVRRGGIAANVSFGLAQLGVTSLLVDSVGKDFEDYRSWLERHGVDTSHVQTSATAHTARFTCTTDQEQNQIASFYPGAMSEAREIELKPIADKVGGLDLVTISAGDPEAMLRHSQECRDRGFPFLADPGQQLALMDGEQIRKLVEGAKYLFTNEYEHTLLLQKTGWSHDEVLGKVGMWVTTLGEQGVRVESTKAETIEIAPVKPKQIGDPTGAGDALRAGFLTGLARGLDLERSIQIGCTLATTSLETDGPQEYDVEKGSFVARFAEAYGDKAAADVDAVLR